LSTPRSRTLASFLLFMGELPHTHTKPQAKLQFRLFQSYIVYWSRGEDKKTLDVNESRQSPNSFLLLISLWIQFLFVSVVPRFALITFSEDLVSVFEPG
jgi:hypothetical protein